MARRALRKTNRNTDYADYLWTLDDLPHAADAQRLFGHAAPLEVEVGSGKGLFIRNASAAHPDRLYLGIEVAGKYAHLVAARLAKDGCTNAGMIHGDALPVFEQKLADDSVNDVHVYFPDPWWKARHRRRRVVNELFLREVQRVLVPGGRFHLWTDVKEYFDSSLQLIADTSPLEGPWEVTQETALHDLDYRTHFERRVRTNGLPVYRAQFAKRAWQVEFTAGWGLPTAGNREPTQ